MYKIGMIGERSSVLGFMALGFSVFEADSPQTAAPLLHRLAESGEYAVIFLTEELAAQMEEDIRRYKDAPLPAVTAIPGVMGTNGYGIGAMKDAVVRAAGADVVFKEN